MAGPDGGAPAVAILGRPNVGKSTLFNRLVGGRRAIVDDVPGVTRDRIYGEAAWRGRRLRLIDTGGFDPEAPHGLVAEVGRQVELAVAEAALVLLVVDARAGLTPLDLAIARRLRGRGARPVLVCANKVDGTRQEAAAAEFHRLGFAEVLPIAAESGRGVGDLLDAVVARLGGAPAEAAAPPRTTVAIVGRPNVGKSSLLNRLVGQARAIVRPEPGTTRDALDTPFDLDGRRYLLIDTAGIRARRKVGLTIEAYSALRSRRAIERADVALLLLDPADGVTEQDARIAGLADGAGCGLVLVANKWDLAPPGPEARASFAAAVRGRLAFLAHAPLAFASARTGWRVRGLFDLVDRVQAERTKRVPTPELNAALQRMLERRAPPAAGAGPLKIRYAAQVGTRPPAIALFTNRRQAPQPSYQRYLEHQLRQAFGFQGVPIRLLFRGGRAA
jgi:GTP-binding protein